jgi:hypothetical protein
MSEERENRQMIKNLEDAGRQAAREGRQPPVPHPQTVTDNVVAARYGIVHNAYYDELKAMKRRC